MDACADGYAQTRILQVSTSTVFLVSAISRSCDGDPDGVLVLAVLNNWMQILKKILGFSVCDSNVVLFLFLSMSDCMPGHRSIHPTNQPTTHPSGYRTHPNIIPMIQCTFTSAIIDQSFIFLLPILWDVDQFPSSRLSVSTVMTNQTSHWPHDKIDRTHTSSSCSRVSRFLFHPLSHRLPYQPPTSPSHASHTRFFDFVHWNRTDFKIKQTWSQWKTAGKSGQPNVLFVSRSVLCPFQGMCWLFLLV